MKKMLFWGAVILVVVYWHEVSNFASGNLHSINQSITQWFVDHTPKK